MVSRLIGPRLAPAADERASGDCRIKPPRGGVGTCPLGRSSDSSPGFEADKKRQSEADGDREQQSQRNAKQHPHGQALRVSVALAAGGAKYFYELGVAHGKGSPRRSLVLPSSDLSRSKDGLIG